MLNDLNFVKGAVAKKDILPALTHFRIHNNIIRGYNGKIALSSPIQLNMNCQPKAIAFVKAIEACTGTVQLSMTPTGRVSIKSGTFKAFIDCDPGTFPEVEPEGDKIPLNGKLLIALKKLQPLIAEDDSRRWARGILFRGTSAFATNNAVLTEYWLGYNFPFDLNIPHDAVNELIRIGQEPISMQVTESSVTFHYEGNRWLRTQTYSTEWPDTDRVLNKQITTVEFPTDFFQSVMSLSPFVGKENRLYFNGNGISTATVDNEGASIELPGSPSCGCFNINHIKLLEKIATHFDCSYVATGGPLFFFGDNVRGAISGMREISC